MTGRVCMLVHHLFPRDVRVRREARALAAAGLDVSVICLRGEGEPSRDRWRDIDVFRQPVRRHRGASLPVYLAEYLAMTLLAGRELTRLHRDRPFDVVHLHAPPDFLLAAGLPARLRGARLVLDIHDLTPELYTNRFAGTGGAGARWLTTLVEQGACRLADRVVTVTEAFARLLKERGSDPAKIRVIRNCPDEELFSPNKTPSRRRSGEFRIVHHGTLMRRYGVDVLLDAFARVALERSGARLEIFGEGDLLPELRKRVAEAPLAGRVTLHGDVPQESLAAEIARADLVVVPNRSDPFTDLLLPTKLLEALRMGVATIASATPVVAETFADGGVLLVPPGDADALAGSILDLGKDAPARKRLADRGRAASERFSWSEEKRGLLDLYADLLRR